MKKMPYVWHKGRIAYESREAAVVPGYIKDRKLWFDGYYWAKYLKKWNIPPEEKKK